jgi:DNA-binding CsgD family transcriptional regulator
VLLARARERAAIDAMLRRVRSGHGQGLILRGEPGIGKTALMGYAAETAGRMRVLRTSGVEPETDIGYAALHRLVWPVRGDIDRIPQPQSGALEVALGQAKGPTPDRFLVALAVLSLLAEVAVEQPLLCLVDDAQWADGASLDALAFVARRLDDEPIAMVFATRADEATQMSLVGMSNLHLAGLDRQAASELLDHHDGGRLSPAQRRQVLAVSGGNPLALRELPDALLDGRGVQEPMPLTAGLQDAFLDRVHRHDEETQRLLVIVAADGSGRVETVRSAAASMGLTVDPLDSGQLDDLVVREGERLMFQHPLVRAAVYHGASSADRRAAHRGLAAALQRDPAELHRYAWHLGQAAEAGDEDVARLLERSAHQVSRRAGHAAAAAALARAAELSESEELLGRRLVAAATLSWQGGDIDRARQLLDEAERVERLPDDARLDMAEVQARLELLVGTPADGLAPLRAVVPEALRTDTQRTMPLLMTYGEIGYRANLPSTWVEISDWLDPVPLDGDTPDDALYRLFRGGLRARIGTGPGMRAGDLEAVEQLTDPVKLTRAAGFTWAVGAYELGHRLRHKAVTRARAIGAAGTLAWSLEHQVFDALTRSRFSTAEAYAEEGYHLAVETGQANTACRLQSMRAWLAALQGRADDARGWAEEVLAEATERQLAECLAYAYQALGHLDLVAGAYSEAVGHYEAMVPRSSTAPSGPALHSMAELVEALVRADQLERAADQAARFSIWTGRAASRELQALMARCRALLASGAEADSEYRRSLQLHASTDTPMEQARTELLYGQHLRRSRRRSDAQTHIRAALETFGRIGARAWAERAQDELRAAGGAGSSGDPAVLSTLTHQERRIALAISEGATNREVAAQLFLSPRTVDYHLRKIFQRLRIRSRAELIRLVLTDSDSRLGRGDGDSGDSGVTTQ